MIDWSKSKVSIFKINIRGREEEEEENEEEEEEEGKKEEGGGGRVWIIKYIKVLVFGFWRSRKCLYLDRMKKKGDECEW